MNLDIFIIIQLSIFSNFHCDFFFARELFRIVVLNYQKCLDFLYIIIGF